MYACMYIRMYVCMEQIERGVRRNVASSKGHRM
jgi:hypothetical protein